MIINERESRNDFIEEIVGQIMAAGRTAPKGKGVDLIEIVAVTGDTIAELAQATRDASEDNGMMFFLRDAENIMQANAVILVGTKLMTMSLNCGYCGYPSCAAKSAHPSVPCALNMVTWESPSARWSPGPPICGSTTASCFRSERPRGGSGC